MLFSICMKFSFFNHFIRLMRKLQVVQNAAARLLSGVRKFQHITPTLAALHWLPIWFLIDFKVLMLTYKALNGLGQWCQTVALQMFLDFNSQKPSPPPLLARISGS